jgi:hypothetical protein
MMNKEILHFVDLLHIAVPTQLLIAVRTARGEVVILRCRVAVISRAIHKLIL